MNYFYIYNIILKTMVTIYCNCLSIDYFSCIFKLLKNKRKGEIYTQNDTNLDPVCFRIQVELGSSGEDFDSQGADGAIVRPRLCDCA